MRHMLQSAMEYLMTYGWAILAIAIVMVSLYSLGIFNTGSLQPTASPGSCEVVRTAAQISLAGQCSNLIPKYVGQFGGGYSSYINITNNPGLNPANITVVFWEKTRQTGYQGFIGKGPQPGQVGSEFYLYGDSGSLQCVTPYSATGWTGATSISNWYFLSCTYNGTATKVYVDGNLGASSSGSPYTPLWSNSYNFVIGIHMCCGNYNGSMADVQIYNTSLDAPSIKALYQEGIGGAPIDIQHIVGWWPLNGNANDYSGNNNQGTATGMAWNANWESGYTAPTA